jgi:hypothetical protein
VTLLVVPIGWRQEVGGQAADVLTLEQAIGIALEESPDIAKRVRPDIAAIGQKYGVRIKVAEIPPGPPVLQTLVAEVYGPDYRRQIEGAQQILDLFEQTEGVVDVDWYVEDDQRKARFLVDKEKASLNGISTEQIAHTLRIAVEGMTVGLAHLPWEKEDLPIVLAPAPGRTFEHRGPQRDSGAVPLGTTGATWRAGPGGAGPRRQEHLPQEPHARGLRHRRCCTSSRARRISRQR